MRHRPALAPLLIAFLVLGAPVWAGDGTSGAPPLASGLEVVSRPYAFSLSRWEARALAGLVGRGLAQSWRPGLDPTADRRAVERFAELTMLADRLSSQRDEASTLPVGQERTRRLTEVGQQLFAVDAERDSLTTPVEEIVGWQVEQVLAQDGLREHFLSMDRSGGGLLARLVVTPGVSFDLGGTPNVLFVSPRSRIQLVGSVLVRPSLSFEEIDRLEASADKLNVASLVSPIGGLAAYPSMVPPSGSVAELLRTVCHEWTHHYLAFRPLGQAYFNDYEMRSINETVADLIGMEVGQQVLGEFYAQNVSVSFSRGVSMLGPAGVAEDTAPSFGDLMREIRRTVEVYLADGDVPGAEAYMAEQRAELATKGYFVRRLNTAYLSFFGAYSGGANPYEEKLRRVRAASGSIAEFARRVSDIRSVHDLTVIAGD